MKYISKDEANIVKTSELKIGSTIQFYDTYDNSNNLDRIADEEYHPVLIKVLFNNTERYIVMAQLTRIPHSKKGTKGIEGTVNEQIILIPNDYQRLMFLRQSTLIVDSQIRTWRPRTINSNGRIQVCYPTNLKENKIYYKLPIFKFLCTSK